MACSVLLVDDDESIRASVSMYLADKEFEVYTASGVPEALKMLDSYLPDVLLVDLQMPERDGLEMIREARRRNSATAIIVISGTGDIQKAVQATRMGAMRYLEKPFSLHDLDEAMRQAVDGHTLRAQLARLAEGGLRLEGAGWVLVGASDVMKDIYRKVQMVSRSNQSTVLIQGESGTGKELVARAIFECSERDRNGKFVDVNCAALQRDAPGGGAVRPREGRLHRRHRDPQGPLRRGPRRRHLPGRDRRDAPEAPGQAAAGAGGAVLQARRRHRERHRRLPRHRLHQPRPVADGREGRVPPRPVLPPRRVHHLDPAAARAPARTSPPWPPTSSSNWPGAATSTSSASARTPRSACRTTPGPATCASCATWSSAPSSWAPERPSRRRT